MAGTDEETTFSIGDLARRSGVPVGTLRAWEQRYCLLVPTRSPGGHRRYSEADLRRIEAVRRLVSEGVTLAAAAARVMGTDKGQWANARARPSLPTPLPLPSTGIDRRSLEAAYRATRALLRIRSAPEAVDVLVDLVAELGGGVAPADEAAPGTLPLDLSLGDGPPLLPVVDRKPEVRARIERILPTVLDDARHAAARVRPPANG